MKSAVISARSIAVRMTFIHDSDVEGSAVRRVDPAHRTVYMMGRKSGKFNVRRAMSMEEKTGETAPARPLSAAAKRALQEAEERRAAALRQEAALPKEIGG